MKLMCSILILLSGISFAQSFYTRIGSGYGAGISPEAFTSTRQTSADYTIHESNKFSFGQGLYFSAALGYNISPSAAFEIEINYMKGDALSTTYYVLNPAPYYLDQKLEIKGKSYTLNPSLILSTKWGFLTPYVRFGAIAGYASLLEKINQEATSKGPDNSPQFFRSTVELEYESSFVLGMNASVGTYYNITESFAVFADLASKTLSYSPAKVTLEKFTLNGVDRTHEVPQNQRGMEYVESFNSSQENKGTQIEHPFNSLVFSIGLKIGF